ncbi:MAG: hypothetical protein GOVbin2917_51 [Prokaryotic dsDNA virus sp.]|jgi:hypothetical protein|nr:MAG: hypothetical protein GOVbin2917_51 [Prokaryotic dsDNA virus sp.]|tara:strand:+ start:74062 stop:75417 length:1356 start_codon:yes stop_codon:yes gene_type:complete
MAVNPIQFLVAQNASITDGTKTITISGNVDCSRVYSGTAIFLGGADNPAEAVSGTSPDGSGNSTITLRNSWSQGDIVNQQLVSFNTNEGLAEAISNVREIVSNVSAIEDLATQGLIKRINDNEYEVVSISALGEALVGASDASSARTSLGLGSAATKNVGTSSGNLMEVGAFGLGGAVIENFADFNDISETSFIGGNNTILNAPPWMDSRVMGGIHVDKGGRTLQIMPSRFGDLGFRTSFDNVYGDWQEIYHSGNSVNPLNYGIKTHANLPSISDLNTIGASLLTSVVDSSTQNRPDSAVGHVINLSQNNAANSQIVTDRIYNDIWFRTSSGSVYKDFSKLYHSGNTNFNEFGGANAGDVIALGESVTSTLARFYLPINGVIQPSSLSLIGSVSVFKAAVALESNVTNVGLSGISGRKVAVVDVTCSVGLTVGDQLNLRMPTSSDKITINF